MIVRRVNTTVRPAPMAHIDEAPCSEKKNAGMVTIQIEIRDSTARVLGERARRYGLPPEQFVAHSIENLARRPAADFHEAVRRLLSRKRKFTRRTP